MKDKYKKQQKKNKQKQIVSKTEKDAYNQRRDNENNR